MTATPNSPIVVWVIGTATDIGKTTIATALLRYLNGRGIPALGFKPFAASRLRVHADFALENYPRVPGRVFNRDSLALVRASPLTTEADVDLISPWQLFFHRNFDDTLLIRVGSMALGNTRYFTTETALKAMARADLARIVQMLNWPLDSAQIFDPQTESRLHFGPDVRSQAFAALLRRNPRVVVVEGAGPFLPTWGGAPTINHVLVVAEDEVTLYPHTNTKTPHADAEKTRGRTPQLLKAFAKRGVPSYQVPYWVVEAAGRDAAMEKLLGELLTKAGFQL